MAWMAARALQFTKQDAYERGLNALQPLNETTLLIPALLVISVWIDVANSAGRGQVRTHAKQTEQNIYCT
jgi:hypothetical protein